MGFLKTTLLFSCITIATTSALSAKTITVTNTAEFVRKGETVAVKVSSKTPLAVYSKNKEVMSQSVDLNADGVIDEVLFQVDLEPKQQKTFELVEDSKKLTPVVNPTCFGRHVPERMDDFAWENDKVAFRMYGPALEPKDGKASGIDVWSKRVSTPVINKWYKSGHYHNDSGEGADFYKVGASRGCGGIGYLKDGKMITSGNWVNSKVITTGLIRVMFELTYAPVKVGSSIVTETKNISLDAGSNFNKIESRFDVQGGDTIEVAVGVVRRGKKGVMKNDSDNSWFSYREPAMKKNNGTISCGVILPGADKFEDKIGHGMLIKTINADNKFIYYAGTGWSKFGFTDVADWDKAVSAKAYSIKNPLTVTIK